MTLLGAVPGQDFLHQDLNNRLLAAHRGPESGPLPPSPFLRTAVEAAAHNHHQHMHNHQHMHQHNSFNGLGQPSSLVPTPPPHLVSALWLCLVIVIINTTTFIIITNTSTFTLTTAASGCASPSFTPSFDSVVVLVSSSTHIISVVLITTGTTCS